MSKSHPVVKAKSRPVSDRPFAFFCVGPSKTVQAQAVGVTPGELASRFLPQGLPIPSAGRVPMTGDFSGLPTGIQFQNLQRDLLRYWQSVSPSVKEVFPSPSILAKAIADPSKKDQLVSMGVIRLKARPSPPSGSKENPIHAVLPDPPAPPPWPGGR